MKNCFFVFYLFSNIVLFGQKISSIDKFAFVNYLLSNNEFDNALYYLHTQKLLSQDLMYQDSINYFIGWTFYLTGNLDSTCIYLDKVNPNSNFYYKAKFYESLGYILQKKHTEAKTTLSKIKTDSIPHLTQLKFLHYSALALIEGNYSKFDSISQNFDFQYYSISEEQKNLIEYATDLKRIKKKSPFKAALYSSLIPGSGKIYSENPGQGLAAFFTTISVAGIGFESYLRAGINSPQFIISSSLFSIFYLGNIYGSAKSVKIKLKEKHEEIHHLIYLDIHIPLRRVFEY